MGGGETLVAGISQGGSVEWGGNKGFSLALGTGDSWMSALPNELLKSKDHM